MSKAEIGTDIQQAAALLRRGSIVAIPTETVYGLAGNALNDQAVSRIFAVKNRPAFDPMIIHTNRFERIEAWVQEIPEQAQKLARAFMPGPLTLLLPKKNADSRYCHSRLSFSSRTNSQSPSDQSSVIRFGFSTGRAQRQSLRIY